MNSNRIALANCSLRIATLMGRASLQSGISLSASLATYANVAQLIMLREYLHRITYSLPH